MDLSRLVDEDGSVPVTVEAATQNGDSKNISGDLTSSLGNSGPAYASIRHNPSAELVVGKTADSTTASPGDTVTFTAVCDVDPSATGASRCTECHLPPLNRLEQDIGPHDHSLRGIAPQVTGETGPGRGDLVGETSHRLRRDPAFLGDEAGREPLVALAQQLEKPIEAARPVRVESLQVRLPVGPAAQASGHQICILHLKERGLDRNKTKRVLSS